MRYKNIFDFKKPYSSTHSFQVTDAALENMTTGGNFKPSSTRTVVRKRLHIQFKQSHTVQYVHDSPLPP